MSDVKKSIGDIEGGKAPTELTPDVNITISKLWETYRIYPGFMEMHELQTKAIWANGLTDDTIQHDRIIEMQRGHEFCYLAGYAAYILNTITDPPSIEAWHPEIDGVGFQITGTNDFGYPTEIRIRLKSYESENPLTYYVPNYPCEVMQLQMGSDEAGNPVMKEYIIREKPLPQGYGFFLIRTMKGLKGLRGLPEFLTLVHPIRAQLDILNAYVPYAKKQGMGFPAIYKEVFTPKTVNDTKREWASQPQSNKILILSNLDLVDYIQPTEGSYDPSMIMDRIDMLIARKTQMNKLMLQGDPAGYLSASETAITNWEKEIKEQQTYWRAQFQPILTVLGADDDCAFQDPVSPAFISLMEGLKAAREAMEGIVHNEDIVNLFNEYLRKNGKDWILTPITEEEQVQLQNKMMQSGENRNGNNQGDQPDQGSSDQ